mgnify:CR=1 FL=1
MADLVRYSDKDLNEFKVLIEAKLVEAQFGSEHIQKEGWRLLPAPQLTVGSCQIENSTSNIDLQMKSRLKQVLESFLQDALHQ